MISFRATEEAASRTTNAASGEIKLVLSAIGVFSDKLIITGQSAAPSRAPERQSLLKSFTPSPFVC